MIKSTACLAFSFSVASAAALADWPMFHGNAQHTGVTTAIGPTLGLVKQRLDLGEPIVNSPIVGPDGTVYVGCVTSHNHRPQYCLAAVAPDGTVKWQFPLGFLDHDLPTQSSPALGAGGVVYVGGMDAFYAIAADGSLLWKYASPTIVIQTPIVAGDGSIAVGIDGKLTVFSSGGLVRWQVPIMEPQLSGGPALSNDGQTVYAVSGIEGVGSAMHAYQLATGTRLWTLTLDEFFWPLAPPTVGPDGTIYTATTGIEAINPNGTIKWFSQPTFGMNSFAAIAVDAQSNLYYAAYVYIFKLNASGAVVWQKTITEDGSRLGSSYSSMLIDGAGTIYIGFGTGKRWPLGFEKGMWILNSNGTVKKKVLFDEIPYISSPALANDGTLYIGTLGGSLYALHD